MRKYKASPLPEGQRYENDYVSHYTMRMNYSDLPDSVPVPPYWITKYKMSPIWNSPLHSHEYIQIDYICKGHAVHVLQAKEYPMTRGDVCIIPPGVEHRLGEEISEEGYAVQLELMPAFFYRGQQSFPLPASCEEYELLAPFLVSVDQVLPKFSLSASDLSAVEAIFDEMLRENAERRPEYEHMLRALTDKLLTLFKRALHREENKNGCTPRLNAQRRYIIEAADYIRRNYASGLTVDEVARKFMISTSYFSFLFKSVTDKTFVKYLNSVRVLRAQELLRQSDFLVRDIGWMVGFHSVNNFNRAFFEEVGLSPRAYRKICQGGSDDGISSGSA